MRIEIFMVIVTSIVLFNTYYNGVMFKWIHNQKKYIQMGGILLLSFSIYLMLKRNPEKARTALLQATNYVKYLPVNKSTVDQFSNIFDFTSLEHDNENTIHYNNTNSYNENNNNNNNNTQNNETKVKRVVSETKKKYVASMQDWKCGNCHSKLSAWFEIDHKKRLEYGGSNNVDNLVALCRECHGEKTAMEKM